MLTFLVEFALEKSRSQSSNSSRFVYIIIRSVEFYEIS